MMKFAKALDTVLNPTRKAVYVAIVSMFGLQVIVVFAQVVSRYIFNDPFSWTEELAKFLQVWIVLLASSVCIREGTHLMVDYLVHYLPKTFRRMLSIFVTLLMMVFISVIIASGIKMMTLTWTDTSPALHIRMGIIYLVFPVAGGLMWLESLAVFLKLLRSNHTTGLDAA